MFRYSGEYLSASESSIEIISSDLPNTHLTYCALIQASAPSIPPPYLRKSVHYFISVFVLFSVPLEDEKSALSVVV